jgi:DNA-binding transcriptional regulator YiaG
MIFDVGLQGVPSQVKTHSAACGLTQTAYGLLIGAKLRTVQDWESGARKMPPSKWELVQIKNRVAGVGES